MDKLRLGDKKLLLLLSFASLLSASFGGLVLYSMRFVTDYAVAGNVSALVQISKFMFLIILLELGLHFLITKVKSIYLNKSVKDLKKFYIQDLFNLDILSLNSKSVNQYLSQLSNDMDRYEKKFYINLIELIGVSSQLLVSLIILASFHFSLFFIALGLFVFFIFMANKSSKPIEEKEQKKSSSLQKYTQYVEESLNGFWEVKQNQLEDKRKHLFSKHAQEVQKDNYELDKKTSQIDALNGLVQMMILFTMILAGLLVAKKLELSLGTTLIAGSAFANSTWPMQRVAPLISEMRGSSILINDFQKTLLSQADDGTETLNCIKQLDFDKASFAYDEHLILSDVSLEIKSGEKILIVGESGAGKSTLLKGIRRQLKPIAGSIKCNKLNVDEFLAQDYFGAIAVVDQIGFIFNGSVLDNITLYEDVEEQDVSKLLWDVGLNDLNPLDILKNNGNNISGGQRARLLLARALFKKKSLVVCDEIFANLDASLAKEIEKDILSIPTTLINVSHILFEENIELYDKIFLVESGHVSQINTLQALEKKI